MGIKMLIKEACLVPAAGAPTGQPAEVAETVEIDTKEDALMLARAGRAYFLDKGNDPTKGLLTATKEEIDQVKDHAKAITAARKERDTERQLQSPTGQAAFMAAEIAKAVAVALGQPSAKPAA